MKSQHRRAELANLVCSLIQHNRIRTTIAKAKVARRWADRMITLAKKADLHHRRRAIAFLRHKPSVQLLFSELGKRHADRVGGYTRIIRLGQRPGDAAQMAILEWTGSLVPSAVEPVKEKATKQTKPKAAKPGKPTKSKPETKASKEASST
jgi:large subunit ribosomal protein L17